jgi:hypothetical protein
VLFIELKSGQKSWTFCKDVSSEILILLKPYWKALERMSEQGKKGKS